MDLSFEELRDEARKILARESEARLAYEKKKRDQWLNYMSKGSNISLNWQLAIRDSEDLEKEWERANVEKLALWYAITRLRKEALIFREEI